MSILRNHTILTEVLDNDEVIERFNDVFHCLHEIMKLVMATRFLDDNEIERVSELCKTFSEVFHRAFPDRSITRKIHELVFNVPRFIKQWRTLGLFSEQEGESKHNAVNRQLRVLACMREPSEKLRLVMEREELRSFADKRVMTKPVRLCQVCLDNGNGRQFLRCTKDGSRKCKKCDPASFL